MLISEATCRSSLRWVIGCLLGVSISTCLFFGYALWSLSFVQLPEQSVTMKLRVESGEGVHHVAARLAKQGVIMHPRLFVLAYRWFYAQRPILKGAYLLQSEDSQWAMVHRLGTAARLMGKFTVIEGWRWQQLYQALQEEKRLWPHSESEIVRYFHQRVPCPSSSGKRCLEGLFLAGTYYFYEGSDDLSILQTAHDALNQVLTQSWERRMPGLSYHTPYEALIVASLIQKESALIAEYPKIASVILRRIDLGMPLQIDAAVLYGLGRRKGPVTLKDLKRISPYNNYKHKGLPPTPIATVSVDAIDAALKPDKTKSYLYYVAKGDGGHHFSINHQQHVQYKHWYRSQNRLKSQHKQWPQEN